MKTPSPFFNRRSELDLLQRVWESPGAQLVTVWGRRRVGKTALLSRFAQDKPGLYVYGTGVTEAAALEAFARTAAETLQEPLLRQTAFQSWTAALDYVSSRVGQDRFLFLLDEFPYLASASQGLDTVLQRWWDLQGSSSRMCVIVSGSAFGFMRQLTGSTGGLHGRRTAHLVVHPFGYGDAAAFYPDLSPDDRVRAYAMVGGIPAYLLHWLGADDLREAALSTFLAQGHFLFTDAEELLRIEFHQEAFYASILRAMAAGERRPGKIARALGRGSASDVLPYLRRLVEMGLIRREVPVTEHGKPRSRWAEYRLADPYLRFWNAFVAPYQSLVQLGRSVYVWDELVTPELDRFVSRTAWEEVVAQFLQERLRAGEEPLFQQLGRWWDGRSEIDLVGVLRGRVVLIGECKWTRQPIGPQALDELRGQAAGLPLGPETLWVLASRSGFTSELRELSRQQRLLLIEPEDLFGRAGGG